jgi:hypothetical protein
MPDLVAALASVFGGGDVTVFQATIDAVGTGVVTIHVNGGTFTDVPFIAGGFYPAAGPAINDRCYVIGRKGWGMVVLGKPASGPSRDPGSDESGFQQAVWFYTSGNPMPVGASLASASLNLGGSWTSTDAVDWDYVEIGLHASNPGDDSYLNKMANLSQTYRFPRTFALAYFSIPLDWISRLINGTAKGIYAEALDYPITFTGSGELRLTTL